MGKSLGMIEYKTVSEGVSALDLMVKTGDVSIIEAQTVCPGKYIAIVEGDLSSVKSAVESAITTYPKGHIDSFVLGNPHESIFSAIVGASKIEVIKSLGILETFNASAIIVASDIASKTSDVELIEIRMARGMCGKSYLMLTGEVSAVQSAIDASKAKVGEKGMLLDSTVIARPDKKICDSIL